MYVEKFACWNNACRNIKNVEMKHVQKSACWIQACWKTCMFISMYVEKIALWKMCRSNHYFSLQPHDFLIIFRSISAQCLNYWHWRPITPIDWQLCLFFFSKVFRVHELFALFWICYFYFCHILMSAPLLPCLLRLLFVPFMRFVDAGKKIRFISSI